MIQTTHDIRDQAGAQMNQVDTRGDNGRVRALRICVLGLGGGGFHWEAQRIIGAIDRPLELVLIFAGPAGGLRYWTTDDAVVAEHIVRSPSLTGDGAVVKAMRVLGNIVQAVRILRKERPDITLGVGTAQAVPFGIAARILGRELWYAESITRMRMPCRTTMIMRRFKLARRIYFFSKDLKEYIPDGICMEEAEQ